MHRFRYAVLAALLVLVAGYALALGLHARHTVVAASPVVVVDGVVFDAGALCADHAGGETAARGDCPLCRLPVADLWPAAPATPVTIAAGRAVAFAAPVVRLGKRRGWAPGNARAPPFV